MLYAIVLFHLRTESVLVDYVEQPRVTLGVPELVYRPDFLVIPADGAPYYVDVKGVETAAFKRNKKLWRVYGWLPLLVIKHHGGNSFSVVETVTPERRVKHGEDPEPGKPGEEERPGGQSATNG